MIDPAVAPPRLTRHQLDLLAGLTTGGSVPAADLAALEELGAVGQGQVHPDLLGPLAVLGATTATVTVRRWRQGHRTDLAAALGPDGLLTLIGPGDPDAVVDVGHRPRASSAARVLARFVDLGPSLDRDENVGRSEHPFHWDDLLAAAGVDPPPWVPAPAGPTARPCLWELRGRRVEDGSSSALVVLDLGGRGLTEVVPADAAAGTLTLRPRRSEELWWGLCRMVDDLLTRPGAATTPAR